MMDLIGEKKTLSLTELERMQTMKTGALLRFACTAPVFMTNEDGEKLKALETYASSIGLMFQITDDILDVEGDSYVVGKTLGKDNTAQKSTFVSILGLDVAKQSAEQLREKALEALHFFGEQASTLKQVTDFILTRNK